MTKIAYLECPTGIAGDMCLGALVDAGVPLDYLIEALGQLDLAQEYQLRAEKVYRNGQQATKVHVDLAPAVAPLIETDTLTTDQTHYEFSSALQDATTAGPDLSEPDLSVPTDQPPPPDHHHHPPDSGHHHHHHHHHSHAAEATLATNGHHPAVAVTRHLPEIERLIAAANLPQQATIWSLAIFRQLAEAEGAVHGISPEQVHFHEVGAVDAIVDIVGTCLGLDWLGIERVYCSALPTGGGMIRAAHGRLPVPAPAVLKLFELRQVPLYSNGIERELVTPTGAAIATTLTTQFGPPPSMTLLRVGLGAGSLNLPIPNILRLWIGERQRQSLNLTTAAMTSGSSGAGVPAAGAPLLPAIAHPPTDYQPADGVTVTETITVLETQIDDLNPQAIGYLYDVLFAVGAVDVFTQAIAMKKSRLGTLLTVICQPEAVPACEAVIFRETTTLGIRRSTQQRQILDRAIHTVQTAYGTVRVKVARAKVDPPINVQPEYEDCAAIARQHQLPWREVHRLALQAWYSKQ